MSDASGDPLYRSDTRAAPSGAQQADLAPVSDQPSDHWEQQAAQRDAEDPAAPSTDPMGAEPQPQAANNEETTPAAPNGQPGPAVQSAASTASPAPSASAASAQDGSPSFPQATESDAGQGQARDASTAAVLDHGSSLALGGQMAWSDPGGDHVRSGEISVNLSQATIVGGALNMAAFGDEGGSGLSGLAPTNLSSSAEAALSQAVAAAQGAVAMAHGATVSAALDQVTALPAALDGALDPVLQSTSSALDGLSSVAAPIDAGLGQANDAVTHLSADILDPGVTTGPIASAVEPLSDSLSDAGALLSDSDELLDDLGATPEASSGPSQGLLASLFTPADSGSSGANVPVVHEALPDLDLGGLLGSADDHADLGHLGL
jgi:hypothetical protein